MAYEEESSASGHDEPWIQWYVTRASTDRATCSHPFCVPRINGTKPTIHQIQKKSWLPLPVVSVWYFGAQESWLSYDELLIGLMYSFTFLLMLSLFLGSVDSKVMKCSVKWNDLILRMGLIYTACGHVFQIFQIVWI